MPHAILAAPRRQLRSIYIKQSEGDADAGGVSLRLGAADEVQNDPGQHDQPEDGPDADEGDFHSCRRTSFESGDDAEVTRSPSDP